ncbi:MAG: ELM1/GtrOC1 family putative glycosyltransferase [Dongiaceae bacterium]
MPLQTAADDRSRQPTIWAISAWRAGDHAQLVALAAALEEAFGWQTSFMPVFDRRQDPAGFGYQGPWPDAVIGIGRGGTRLGLWIKRQSGGKTKFIQLGRSEGPMADCDLIVTTAQYGFPDNANLIRLTLPLTQRGKAGDASVAQWADRFAGLPRPLTGVLVGGPSDPLLMGPAEATRLARDIGALADKSGGSLLIATGRRTPAEMVKTLTEMVGRAPDRHRLIVFPAEGFARPEDNPYRAILALADRFIVTADSVSMLADACATGKPVTLFDLPAAPEKLNYKEYWRWRRRRRFAAGKRPDLIDRLYDAGIRRGVIRPGRDVPTLIAWLLRGGGVSGDAAKAAEMAGRLAAERQRVLNRIQGLLAPGRGQPDSPA